MEEKNFNIFVYAFKMLVFSCIWMIIVSWVVFNIPNLPQKLIIIQFNPDAVFSFELSNLTALLIALISQYVLFVKGGLYFYTFKTNCKNPIFCLFSNIAFGGFICLNIGENVSYNGIEASFIAQMFTIMAIVNYFIFYARYGYEFREKDFINNWNKTVYIQEDFLKKNK